MSERDMGPSEAAEYATGEQSGSGHGSAGQGEASFSRSQNSSLIERFFDGSASGPEMQKVKTEYDLETSLALVLRGVLRAAPGDGMPPIGEILLGSMLAFKERADFSGESGESDDMGPDGDIRLG